MDLKDLTVEEINTVLAGLAKLPFENVNALITKIHGQGQAQLPGSTPPAAEAAPAAEPPAVA